MKYILFWTIAITFTIVFVFLGMVEFMVVATQGVVLFPKLMLACFLIALGIYIWIGGNRAL